MYDSEVEDASASPGGAALLVVFALVFAPRCGSTTTSSGDATELSRIFLLVMSLSVVVAVVVAQNFNAIVVVVGL